MKTDVHRRVLVVLLALAIAHGGTTLAGQAPESTPLGALRTNGEVFVNESRVSGEVTLFSGDTLRTGADGAAGLSVPGRGVLTLGANSQMTFPPSSPTRRYIATLTRGTAGLRSVLNAAGFQVHVGHFVVVPVPDMESGAEIEVDAAGQARITCKMGSVGVVALEGAEALFLTANQAVTISADGKLQGGPAAPPAAPESPTPGTAKKKSHTGYVILGLAAGGAAGAAVALGNRKGQAPASPSIP